MFTTKRNVVTNILLTIVTCGIWGIVWMIQLVDDVNAATRSTDAPSGGMVFLLNMVTCGIYMLFWFYKAGDRLDTARAAHGLSSKDRGMMYLLLSLFGLGLVSFALIQSDLNEIADVNLGQGQSIQQ